jgi:hypothetical protein
MPKLAPTFYCKVLKQAKKERVVPFFLLETLEGCNFLQLGGDGWLETCAMVLQELYSDPMLNFFYDWLKQEAYFI